MPCLMHDTRVLHIDVIMQLLSYRVEFHTEIGNFELPITKVFTLFEYIGEM